MSKQPRAVLLDIDGTLLDSNDAHAKAWVDVMNEFGKPVDFQHIRSLIGKGGDKVIPEVTGHPKESPEGERIAERRGEIFRERYLPKLEPTPGARAFCHRLRDDGIKLVIATSAAKDEVDGLLERAGVSDLIQDETSAGDVEASKPDPDIFMAARQKGGYPAELTVVLGDTPYDVEAATRAGLRIVALRSGGWGDTDLAGAVEIYDHPQDLLAHFDKSVFGRDNGG